MVKQLPNVERNDDDKSKTTPFGNGILVLDDDDSSCAQSPREIFRFFCHEVRNSHFLCKLRQIIKVSQLIA